VNQILAVGSLAMAYGSSFAQTGTSGSAGQPVTLQVNASETVAPIQSTMWGIFFEDINFAADGGIYAEMVKNRSFAFDTPMMGWQEPNSDRHSLNENSGIASVIR